MSTTGTGSGRTLDYDAVVRVTGSIAPWKIAEILALNATVEELEQAVAWASVEAGDSGLHHDSAGDAVAEARVAGIYGILVADRAEVDEA
jgi:hypothetical protein